MIPKMGKPKDVGLDDIEKEVKRLQGRATTLQSKAIVRTDANVEKTGCAVTIIKNNTQNIERIMIEELRPVMIETYHLVREARLGTGSYARRDWPTDFDAEATRIKDTHASPSWLPVRICCPGPPSLQRRIAAVGSLFVFGGREGFSQFSVEELVGMMVGAVANTILNSLPPKQWEYTYYHGTKVSGLFSGGTWQFLIAAEEAKAAIPYRDSFSWKPGTCHAVIRIDLYAYGKSPIHCDDFTVTDTYNSPRKGTSCRF